MPHEGKCRVVAGWWETIEQPSPSRTPEDQFAMISSSVSRRVHRERDRRSSLHTEPDAILASTRRPQYRVRDPDCVVARSCLSSPPSRAVRRGPTECRMASHGHLRTAGTIGSPTA